MSFHTRRLVPLVSAALLATTSPARAQCNCSCDGLVPPGQQITQSIMNENGLGPTLMLSFGQTVEVRHANSFLTPMTITHVCVALDYPSTPPATGQVFVATADAGNSFLPAAPGFQQSFLINPGLVGGHQLIELSSPQVVSGSYWVGIAYPSAQAGMGHQGARPRTAGDSAVYADGVGWEYYDNTGSGFYIGNAPIIRPLTLTPPPLVTCPPGAIVENEPLCGLPLDVTNGGCLSVPPVFEPISCGDTFCGSSAYDGINRDTDWFELTLTQTTRIVFDVQATFDQQVSLLQPGAGNPCLTTTLDTVVGVAGTTVTISRVLGPGTWWLVVEPDISGVAIPCPSLYTATLSCCTACDPADVPEGEACGTDVNGGCDTNGVMTPVQCGTTICGSLWKDPTGSDSDWYELQVPPAPGGFAFVDLEMVSEFPAEVVLQYDTCPCSISNPACTWAMVDGKLTQPCVPEHIVGGVPAPGTYWIRVAPSPASTADFPCGSTNAYRMTVDVTPCNTGGGAPNDDCTSSQLTFPGILPIDTSIATASGWNDPPCGFNGGEVDLWYEFIAPCDRLYLMAVVPLTPPLDRMIAVYSDCPVAGGTPIDCAQATGGAPAEVFIQAVAGETFKIRASAPAGIVGLSDLLIDYTTLCPADLNGDCTVVVADLLILISSWGQCALCPADLDGDGQVGVSDMLILIAAWGPC